MLDHEYDYGDPIEVHLLDWEDPETGRSRWSWKRGTVTDYRESPITNVTDTKLDYVKVEFDDKSERTDWFEVAGTRHPNVVERLADLGKGPGP